MGRKGRYNHQLISSEYYQTHGPALVEWTRHLNTLYKQPHSEMAPNFVTHWVLGVGLSAKGLGFLQNHPSYAVLKSDESFLTEGPASNTDSLSPTLEMVLYDLFDFQLLPWMKQKSDLLGLKNQILLQKNIWSVLNFCELRGLPPSVRKALLFWKQGSYSLKLFRTTISSEEVFNLQKQFCRCVTLFSELGDFQSLHHGRDAWAFTIHDLIHADHFYRNSQEAKQQVGFLRWLDDVQKVENFNLYLEDLEFHHQFEYLMSDMNAYCGHLTKTLQALISQAHSRQAGASASRPIWQDIIWQQADMDLSIKNSFLKVNTEAFQVEDFKNIELFLSLKAQ